MADHGAHKDMLAPLRAAQYDWDQNAVKRALAAACAPDVVFHLCHPFGDFTGAEAFAGGPLAQLSAALPDIERRDWIVMAGKDEQGADWVGCGGHFMGTFRAPLLGIPPTGHLAHIRFHEFHRVENGKIVEYQAIWDLPELMMQAGAWPMAPSLGREFCVPGPATGDGIHRPARDPDISAQSQQLIIDMLHHMKRHPSQGGPEVMEMDRFWHERMNWYGPAGIGTGRGIQGFRHWHQIPFLNAMPDRGLKWPEITYHFFGDNNYTAVTGWPNMIQSVTDDGWLGMVPNGREISMRSLDFWRIENGKIRENWVMVDLLDMYRQMGVDVFSRLAEFNKARNLGPIAALHEGMT